MKLLQKSDANKVTVSWLSSVCLAAHLSAQALLFAWLAVIAIVA
jgi:hypothetical protein